MSVMSTAAAPVARMLPLRLALRELRGGVRGFGVFIACIALGVAAIAGVGSFAQGLVDGLAREGRAILGGDLSFILIQREASADERAFLASQGEISAAATLRAMARTADGRAALTAEPDKLAGGIGFGPRLMLSQQALRASGLLQPGSLVRWLYRIRLAD